MAKKNNLLDPVGAAERKWVSTAEKSRALCDEFKEMGIWVSDPSKTGRDEISTPTPGTVLKVIEIAKKITKGKTRLDVMNEMMAEGCSMRKAEYYYDAAVRFLTPNDPEEFKKGLIAKNMAKFEDLYQKAYEAGQYKTCRDILDSLNKMYGLSGGNQVNIAENAEGERVIQIKFD